MMDGDDVKSLYRRAVAQHRLGELSASRDGLMQALALSPDYEPAQKELATVRAAISLSVRRQVTPAEERTKVYFIFSQKMKYN